jgi:hypothetical protein
MHEKIKDDNNNSCNSTNTTPKKVFQNVWSKELQVFYKPLNFKQCSLLAYTDSQSYAQSTEGFNITVSHSTENIKKKQKNYSGCTHLKPRAGVSNMWPASSFYTALSCLLFQLQNTAKPCVLFLSVLVNNTVHCQGYTVLVTDRWMNKWIWSIYGKTMTGKNAGTQINIHPNVNLSTTDPTQTCLQHNGWLSFFFNLLIFNVCTDWHALHAQKHATYVSRETNMQ